MLTVNNSNFYLSTFPAKWMTAFFKIKKKNYFGLIFEQRVFFQKALAKNNCSGSPAFKCQRYGLDWPSHPKLFHMQKLFSQSAPFIKSFVRYTWFKSLMIYYKPSPIFGLAHPIIITVTFSFPKFVLACKKSTYFMNSFLRYSKF